MCWTKVRQCNACYPSAATFDLLFPFLVPSVLFITTQFTNFFLIALSTIPAIAVSYGAQYRDGKHNSDFPADGPDLFYCTSLSTQWTTSRDCWRAMLENDKCVPLEDMAAALGNSFAPKSRWKLLGGYGSGYILPATLFLECSTVLAGRGNCHCLQKSPSSSWQNTRSAEARRRGMKHP
jgi:hypothetical protein